MPNETEIDFSTGIYRCNDISSIKIRVHLKTIKSSSVPLSGLQEDVQDDKMEEQVFSWQQRIFSPQEVNFYSNLDNCKSELHKKYYQHLLELSDEERSKKNIIFSYTSVDIDLKAEKDIYCDGFETSSYLSESMKHKFLSCQEEMPHNKDVPKCNIVNTETKSVVKNHMFTSSQEFMYIMADVGYMTEGEANEQILVIMRWQPLLKVLTIFPDFNNDASGPGYTLEGLSDACYQYVFWVTCSKPDVHDVSRLQKEVKYDEIKIIPTDIILPRHGLLDVHIFGEIKSAKHFDSDNIFVNYCFELPEDFVLFPQLLLEVVSIDSWGRVCRDGCGWAGLPPIPGFHHFTVRTWRSSTNESCKDSLRRYFTGATSHLADRSYFGVPKSFQGSSLSKYGFLTITSGDIDIYINIVLCSQDPSQFSSRMFLLERLSTTALVKSINNTLKAFSSARQRMLTASLLASSN
ncbi:Meckel syndrome, type 1 isoform X2 [Lycorma delicatula]|uniref:Meckel syndrome, type 1 isoform X2 n=1 Tax=Lycorma delicatula TaxID=130591 RepID=UPI003F516F09